MLISGYLNYPLFPGYRDTLEEKSRVQIKGRFSVTSEDVDIVKVKVISYEKY